MKLIQATSLIIHKWPVKHKLKVYILSDICVGVEAKTYLTLITYHVIDITLTG